MPRVTDNKHTLSRQVQLWQNTIKLTADTTHSKVGFQCMDYAKVKTTQDKRIQLRVDSITMFYKNDELEYVSMASGINTLYQKFPAGYVAIRS